MKKSANERIVISGVGMVSSLGCGTTRVWERMLAGQSGVRKINVSTSEEHNLPYLAGVIPSYEDDLEGGFLANRYFTSKELQRTNRFIQLAIASTEEALMQAEWIELTPNQKERTGVIIASGLGGILSLMEAAGDLQTKGQRTVSAFSIPLALTNSAASAISIRYGFRGPMYAPGSACAASLQAIDEAIKMLHNKEADVVVVGGSEAPIHEVILAGFSASGALSLNYMETPEQASRPFDTSRDGFVLAEGSSIFVIETLSHARARGAKPLAEIVGFGTASDAYHITSGAKDGEGVARAMKTALDSANIPHKEVGYVSTHATSTPVGDEREYLGIERVFGLNSTVSLSANKGAFGHAQGAASAISLAMLLKSLVSQTIPYTLNTQNISSRMTSLDIVMQEPRKKTFEYAMINGFGFGGINCSAALKRYEEN